MKCLCCGLAGIVLSLISSAAMSAMMKLVGTWHDTRLIPMHLVDEIVQHATIEYMRLCIMKPYRAARSAFCKPIVLDQSHSNTCCANQFGGGGTEDLVQPVIRGAVTFFLSIQKGLPADNA